MCIGHQYIITRHITAHVKEYQCKRCHYKATINGSGKLIALNKTHQDINRVLEDIYKKRLSRKKTVTIPY